MRIACKKIHKKPLFFNGTELKKYLHISRFTYVPFTSISNFMTIGEVCFVKRDISQDS